VKLQKIRTDELTHIEMIKDFMAKAGFDASAMN